MTSASAISWFFGENGSMDGGMTWTIEGSIHPGTYWRREKTNASHAVRYGRRNDQASSVQWLVPSRPTWHRQTTRAPAPASGAAIPAVWGSCSSTTSPRRTRSRALAALAEVTCS